MIITDIGRVIASFGLCVEEQSRWTRERVSDDAQVGRAAVEAPVILFAVFRVWVEAFVLALESGRNVERRVSLA